MNGTTPNKASSSSSSSSQRKRTGAVSVIPSGDMGAGISLSETTDHERDDDDVNEIRQIQADSNLFANVWDTTSTGQGGRGSKKSYPDMDGIAMMERNRIL